MVTVCSSSRTDRGLVRPDNQDHLLLQSARGLYAVADGMGGAAEGARASAMVVAALLKAKTLSLFGRLLKPQPRFPQVLDVINYALLHANRDIIAYTRRRQLKQMGSTVALLVFDPENEARAAVCHVGDSRIYRLRGNRVQPLTRDHSVGRELYEKLGPVRGKAFLSRENPLAHVLTRSVGVDAILEPEWRRIDVAKGDRFLICSDGLHDVIDEGELLNFLAGGDLEAVAQHLQDAIVARGAPDNYSFIVLAVS